MDIKRELNLCTIDKKIIEIFNDNGYAADNIKIEQIKAYYFIYRTEIYSTCETTINNINLCLFIEEHLNEGLEVRSILRKSKISINFIQCEQIRQHLYNKIKQGIAEVLDDTLKNKMDAIKTLNPKLQDWKRLLEKIQQFATVSTTKEHQIDEKYLVSSLLKIVEPILQKETNQKGTNNITNKEAALIYDLLYYIKFNSRNTIATNKEKSDYIRQRLKRKVGNSIVEK